MVEQDVALDPRLFDPTLPGPTLDPLVVAQGSRDHVGQSEQDLQWDNQVHQEILDSNEAIIGAQSTERAAEDVLNDTV